MKRDQELLAEYLQTGSQEVFEVIAQRHTHMVYGVCRRIVGEHHAAEDAAQAVFLALVQSRERLRNHECLAGWLYRTATQTSLHYLRVKAALRRREMEAGAMQNTTSTTHELWADLAPRLDQALIALPEKYRQAVILRYLEGHSRSSAAQCMGVPEKTLETWVYRGLERLRTRLQGQGVAMAAPLLAQVLESHQVLAPASLVQSVTQLAAPGAASAAAVAPHVQQLMEGTLKTVFWGKVKVVAASVVLATALTAAAAMPLVGGQGEAPAVAQRVDGSAETAGEKPAAAIEAVPAKPGEYLVLDGTGYFRQYTEFGLMRINSELLRSEGEKIFGARIGEVERRVKRVLKNKGYDWTKTDWRDVARYHIPSIQTGDDSLAVSMLETVPATAGWMKPEFDDGAFVRQRLGVLTPITPAWGIGRATSSMHRQAVYVRTYFDIPDPAQAGELSLKVSYRGGARVFVNGEEIMRGHLPKGEINSDSVAEDYPIEAYLAESDEQAPKKPSPWIGDLRCPFDMAPTDWRLNGDTTYRNAFGLSIVNRKGWERLMAARDRVLGPVRVPSRLLRKGANVLAIEIRTSRYHPRCLAGKPGESGFNGDGCNFSAFWDHVRLVGLELRSTSKSVPACAQRPAGMQLWAEDLHSRMVDRDFIPPGWSAGTLRFVAAQNGNFAAQAALSTDKELSGLNASCSELVSESGAKIPGDAIQVQYMVGHGLHEMSKLGWFRSFDNIAEGECPMSTVALYRYAQGVNPYGELPADPKAAQNARAQYLREFKFFDHIGAQPPAKVPANTCQPLWLTLKVPAAAGPGKYKGKLTVQADGAAPQTLPVEAEVLGWRVPDPRDFQTLMQSEQSPYGVATAYKVELWSDRHFELMESSFRQLGRLGNDWVFVPVLLFSELGNKDDDGMIKWIKKKDGSFSFEFGRMNRYLEIARKHLGKPKAICFVVMHGAQAPGSFVKITDEASGKTEVVDIGLAQTATRRPAWRAFGSALYAHMKTLGLQDSMFWGHAFDDTFDPQLVALLAEVAPEVGWAAGGHVRKPDTTFRAISAAMGPDLSPQSMQGWKNQFIYVLVPRTGGSIICVEGISTPFTWRVMCDRALYCGMNGLGRMGADYFDNTWWSGFRGGGYNLVGRPCVQTLWPGASGVESSARNEVMLEGVQEAEARIFLEQAADRKLLPEDLGREVEAVLHAHFRSTLYIAAGGVDYGTMDMHGDWQGRSRRLFEAAAKVSQKIGFDVDRATFGQTRFNKFAGGNEGAVVEMVGGEVLTVPALGRSHVALKLRNWSGKPRAFKAVAAEPWIVPEKSEGSVSGQQSLAITLDGKDLKEGADVSGTLTVTDVASGTAYPVKITAKVEKAFDFRITQDVKFGTGGGSGASMPRDVIFKTSPVFNVTAGSTEIQEYLLVNNTAAKQPWKIESAHPWVAIEPASGELAAESSVSVRIVIRPASKEGAAYDTRLTLTAAGGAVKQDYQIKTFVIPTYQAPAVPAGEAVFLNDLDTKKIVKFHMEFGQTQRPGSPRLFPVYHRTHGCGENLNPKYGYNHRTQDWEKDAYTLSGKTFARGLWTIPGHETVYTIEGAGFSAFAAETGFFDKFKDNAGANLGTRVNFEIHVDGKLRAQSGIMGIGDAPRLLVVDGLQNAKELRLVTRRNDLSHDEGCLATWGDPRLIKAK